MAGRFEVFYDVSGAFRFRLKAANGQIIAVSEGYKTRAAALHGIESVRKNAMGAPAVDLTENSAMVKKSVNTARKSLSTRQ